MRLWAISDLHLSHPRNREAFETFPSFPDDWLILAGDIVDGHRRFDWCLDSLKRKFRRIVWVPGNHELWVRPGPGEPRGVALYDKLVAIARRHGVITPEDPYPEVPLPSGPVLIAPLFLLYDYSFRPDHVRADQVIAWARAANNVGADEHLLHPDPFPDRESWCRERCARTAARLEACPPHVPKILVNHYPLEEELAVLPRVPRYTPWCGTRLSRGWHRRFNACAVVYGHLHIRGTSWMDGTPFQEVSLGYPGQWYAERGIGSYLREVIVASPAVRRGV